MFLPISTANRILDLLAGVIKKFILVVIQPADIGGAFSLQASSIT